ncbi:hypothetical protein L211DRAFT_881956 [Terfezia boudieri ATCC MYA-4762]|uniref:Uncharacterized protein n=1 Tax=Terfezia boudieri ATCC MYA-4762 TaxID=1051890 RepID=A0A3N4MA76_9PEZI|nr:hypothetical protein L211DRAFT_881956 [Terfezia boudieri ATCC MYA-4762]
MARQAVFAKELRKIFAPIHDGGTGNSQPILRKRKAKRRTLTDTGMEMADRNSRKKCTGSNHTSEPIPPPAVETQEYIHVQPIHIISPARWTVQSGGLSGRQHNYPHPQVLSAFLYLYSKDPISVIKSHNTWFPSSVFLIFARLEARINIGTAIGYASPQTGGRRNRKNLGTSLKISIYVFRSPRDKMLRIRSQYWGAQVSITGVKCVSILHLDLLSPNSCSYQHYNSCDTPSRHHDVAT